MIFAVHLLCCSVLRRRGGEGGREERKKRWEERNGQGEKWVTRPDFMVKQVRKTWRNWNENKHNFVSTKKSETPLLAAIAPPPIVQVGFLLILFLRFAASAAQQLIPGFEPFHFNSAKGKEEEMSNCFCFSRFCFSSSQPVIVADVGWCCVRKYIGHSRQAQSQAPPSYVVVVATEGRPLGPSRYSCVSVGRQHNATKVPISAYWWAQFCFQVVFFQKRKRKIEKGKLFSSFPLFQIALNLHLTLFPTVTGQRNDRYIKCAIEGFCEVRP